MIKNIELLELDEQKEIYKKSCSNFELHTDIQVLQDCILELRIEVELLKMKLDAINKTRSGNVVE
jgi:hypothetical protein